MFTGFMEVDFKQGSYPIIFHVGAGVSKIAPRGFELKGNCREPLSKSFRLTFEEKTQSSRSVRADLDVRDLGPFPQPPTHFDSLDCFER